MKSIDLDEKIFKMSEDFGDTKIKI